jgi:hypothetical protein
MAANHLTLEEAAARLDMTVDEFKRKLKTDPMFKELDRGKIRDGTSFRFKESAVEELGRELGAGSNPENPLPPVSDAPGHDSDDFKVIPDAPAKAAKEPAKVHEEPLTFAADDSSFALSAEEPKPEGKAKSGSDSDVRLDSGKPRKSAAKGEESVPTEELSIDFGGQGSAVIKGGSSAKLSAPKSSGKLTSDASKSAAKPGTGDSSEFELSLDADSDDFELKLNTETSDEVKLGEMPKDAPGGSSRRGGESGILSRKPNDSGPSLEKGKEKPPPPAALPGLKDDSDSDVDFELTLDSSSAVSSAKLGDLKGKKDDSDSEFELTLDDSGDSGLEHAALGSSADASKGDIFETDFEIPPMEESASEVVTMDSDTDLEKSDSDIAIDEEASTDAASGSEVVLLEEEEEAPVARKGARPRKPAADEEEGDVDLADVEAEEEEESAAGALKGVKGRRRDEEEEEEEAAAVPAGAYRPVPWGVVPTLFLFPAFVLTLVGGLVGFELLQTMWGYQQPQKPAAPLVRGIAKQLDMDLKEQ